MKRITDTSTTRVERAQIRARECEMKRALVRGLDNADLALLVQAVKAHAVTLDKELGSESTDKMQLIEASRSLRNMAGLFREAIDERDAVETREGHS